MLAGDFKPNCALGTSSHSSSELLSLNVLLLVLLDFLVRHGKVNEENEPNLLEILSRMHVSFW